MLVEVTALDAVHQAAAHWLRAEGGDQAAARLSAISETTWKSQIFTVEPVAGFSFSFWSWIDPIKGKPVAVEGDLSAEGMKFAIVVARWNAVITDRLLDGALDVLLRSGALPAPISRSLALTIAVADAQTSRHPLLPHPQTGPSG